MFYNLISDSQNFLISESTLKDHPECLITQIINNENEDDKIYIENNRIYLDMDRSSVKIIVDYLRNYNVNGNDIKDHILLEKVHKDATFLGLNNLADELQSHLPITNTYIEMESFRSLIVELSYVLLKSINTNVNKELSKSRVSEYLDSDNGRCLLSKIYNNLNRSYSVKPELSMFLIILLTQYNKENEELDSFLSHNLSDSPVNNNHIETVKNYKNIINILTDLSNNINNKNDETYTNDDMDSLNDLESINSNSSENDDDLSINTDTEFERDSEVDDKYKPEYISIV